MPRQAGASRSRRLEKCGERCARAAPRALRDAHDAWSATRGFPEGADAYAALAYDGGSPLGEEFAALSRELLLPLVRACVDAP